jgi:hypothetical protein
MREDHLNATKPFVVAVEMENLKDPALLARPSGARCSRQGRRGSWAFLLTQLQYGRERLSNLSHVH